MGTIVPPLLVHYRPKWNLLQNTAFKYFQGIGAGLVIGVAFIHSFTEGTSGLSSESSGWPDYPWGGFFAMVGLLSTWSCEAFISVYMEHIRNKSSQTQLNQVSNESDDVELTTMKHKHEKHHDDKAKDEHCDHALEEIFSPNNPVIHDHTTMLILLFGLTFHSVFVGFAIGLGNELDLFIAILAHQFLEALALGFHLAKSYSTTIRPSIFLVLTPVIVFTLSAPIGTAIGIGVSSSICASDTTFSIVSGIFNSLSAGILIYVGTVHMIKEEFSKSDILSHPLKAFLFWLGVLTGSALMSIIGIWA